MHGVVRTGMKNCLMIQTTCFFHLGNVVRIIMSLNDIFNFLGTSSVRTLKSILSFGKSPGRPGLFA